MPIQKRLSGRKQTRRLPVSRQIQLASSWGDLIELVLLLPLAMLILAETLRRL